MKSAIFAFLLTGVFAIGSLSATTKTQRAGSETSANCICGEKCSECCDADCSSCTMGCCSK